MINGVIIQMGQFNPLHRMHVRIAYDAMMKYPEYTHFMGMATSTCDKGVNSDKDILERVKLIEAQDLRWNLFKSGLFVDVIQDCKLLWGEDVKIVFACGQDTIYRFFRDWDAYWSIPSNYTESRYSEYIDAFHNVEWYVSHRNCPEVDMYMDLALEYLHHHDNIIWSDLDLDDISSTKIRKGEVPNE